MPPDYEQLKAAANRTSSWRERLQAVEQLGQWKSEQVIDVLKYRLSSDSVFQVQEAAFRKLQAFGEPVQLPPKKKGEVIKGTAKILTRIKKSLPEGHSFEEFKLKLSKMRLDVYDAYEGEKGADFEQWLEQTWSSLAVK
ncbi:HEAT repeat domain-containing protein [Paenibacillus hodogayensis]|uniref:HEAT repeat domain-containing protein n=1 Tax=Paenibacillus hodogayensis TaxID=279208 RepID=A0ABV5W460_9BACL